MFSVAPFSHGNPGSNPGWFTVESKSKIEFSQTIEVCGTLESNVTQ